MEPATARKRAIPALPIASASIPVSAEIPCAVEMKPAQAVKRIAEIAQRKKCAATEHATARKRAKTVPPIAETAEMISIAEMAHAVPQAKAASNVPMIAGAARSTAGMGTAMHKKHAVPAAVIAKQRVRNRMSATETAIVVISMENVSVLAMKPANASPTALAVALLSPANARKSAKITASAATILSKWGNFAMTAIVAPKTVVLRSVFQNPVAMARANAEEQ